MGHQLSLVSHKQLVGRLHTLNEQTIMNQQEGMTMTPELVMNENGEEVISYEHGTVRQGSHRIQQIDQFNHFDDGEMFYEGEDGELHHRFENVGDLSQDFEQDFVDELTEEDFFEGNDLSESDMNELQNIVGGPEEYERMTTWMRENGPEEIIDRYDEIMGSSDYPEMERVIKLFHELYREQGQYDNPEEEPDEQDIIDENIQLSNQYVVDKVWGGNDNYQQGMEFGRQVLPPQVIQQFNQQMSNTPDPDRRVELSIQLRQTLLNLHQQMNQR